MIAANDIRSVIGDYLVGKLSFDAFENWLIENTKNIHNSADLDSRTLVSSIDLELAEYVLGYLKESELRLALQVAANTYSVSLGEKDDFTTTTSTASTTNFTDFRQLQMLPADKSRATASELQTPR